MDNQTLENVCNSHHHRHSTAYRWAQQARPAVITIQNINKTVFRFTMAHTNMLQLRLFCSWW